MTSEEYEALRGKNANTFLDFGNGNIYAPPGGGQVGSGLSLKVVVDYDRAVFDIKRLEKWVDNNYERLVEDVREITAELPLKVVYRIEQRREGPVIYTIVNKMRINYRVIFHPNNLVAVIKYITP